MIRHAARQLAIQTLYQMEVGQMAQYEAISNIELMLEALKEEAIQITAEEITPREALELDEQFKLDDFYYSIINGILDQQEKIDEMIKEKLEGWNFARLNKVDKAIIRLATFEMMFDKETPHKIIINEALELTKEFSEIDDKKARSFNNKLLDKISKEITA